MEKKSILITGADGYIGSYLIDRLSNSDYTIFPMVLELKDYFEYWKDKFDIIECDITNLKDLKKKIPKVNFVIHLAALNEVYCFKDPEKALFVNGYGTRNMLEITKELKCEFFVYFSTLQVYGKELQGHITHQSEIRAHNDYALTHYLAEQYCKLFTTNYNMNTIILRPSNIFGSPINKHIDRWSLVPACFCKSAIEEKKIILKSSGKQRRDFITLNYVYSVINFLLKNFKKGFNIYNITSETTFTISEIAELVKETIQNEFNYEIELKYESEFPMVTNKFKVENNLLPPLKKDIIIESFISEIKKMVNLLEEK